MPDSFLGWWKAGSPSSAIPSPEPPDDDEDRDGRSFMQWWDQPEPPRRHVERPDVTRVHVGEPSPPTWWERFAKETEDVSPPVEFLRNIPRLPGTVLEASGYALESLISGLSEPGVTVPGLPMKLRLPGAEEDEIEGITPETTAPANPLQQGAETVARGMQEAGRMWQEGFPVSEAVQRDPLDFTDPNVVANVLGSASSQVASQMALSALTGGGYAAFAAPSLILEGGYGYKEALDRLREEGVPEEEAKERAARESWLRGSAAAVLERGPFEVLMRGRLGRGVVGRVAGGMFTETGEEISQEFSGDVISRAFGDEEAFDDWWRRYTLAGIGGAGGGAVGGGISAATQAVGERQAEKARGRVRRRIIDATEGYDELGIRRGARLEPFPGQEAVQEPRERPRAAPDPYEPIRRRVEALERPPWQMTAQEYSESVEEGVLPPHEMLVEAAMRRGLEVSPDARPDPTAVREEADWYTIDAFEGQTRLEGLPDDELKELFWRAYADFVVEQWPERQEVRSFRYNVNPSGSVTVYWGDKSKVLPVDDPSFYWSEATEEEWGVPSEIIEALDEHRSTTGLRRTGRVELEDPIVQGAFTASEIAERLAQLGQEAERRGMETVEIEGETLFRRLGRVGPEEPTGYTSYPEFMLQDAPEGREGSFLETLLNGLKYRYGDLDFEAMHTTASHYNVAREGLRSRKELGREGTLGGGPPDMVSVGLDPQHAYRIEDRLKAATRVARGDWDYEEIIEYYLDNDDPDVQFHYPDAESVLNAYKVGLRGRAQNEGVDLDDAEEIAEFVRVRYGDSRDARWAFFNDLDQSMPIGTPHEPGGQVLILSWPSAFERYHPRDIRTVTVAIDPKGIRGVNFGERELRLPSDRVWVVGPSEALEGRMPRIRTRGGQVLEEGPEYEAGREKEVAPREISLGPARHIGYRHIPSEAGKEYTNIVIGLTPESAAPGHGGLGPYVKGSHFNEPRNTVGFIRATMRETVDDEAVFFIEEVQSDWISEGRKSEIATGTEVQGTPFRQQQAWLELAFARSLTEAVERGADWLAWANADQLVRMWSSDFRQGYENLYNKMLPRIFDKYLQKYLKTGGVGGVVIKGFRVDPDFGASNLGIKLTPELVEKIRTTPFRLLEHAKGYEGEHPLDFGNFDAVAERASTIVGLHRLSGTPGNRGSTVDPRTGRSLVGRRGFAVPIEEGSFDVVDAGNFDARYEAGFLQTHGERLTSEPELMVGTWEDGTGRVHLDLVEVVESREEALRRARERGQKAVFDLFNLVEIPVGDAVREGGGRMLPQFAWTESLAQTWLSRPARRVLPHLKARVRDGKATEHEVAIYENLLEQVGDVEATSVAEDFPLVQELPQSWTASEADWRSEVEIAFQDVDAESLRELLNMEARRTMVKQGVDGRRYYNLVGERLDSPEKIANLFQVFRDPKRENFVSIYLDDDYNVVGHHLETSDAVDHVLVAPGPGEANIHPVWATAAARAKRLGVSRMIVMHNHPSGNALPSTDDIVVTYHLQEKLAEDGVDLVGQLVIDHEKATWIETDYERPSDIGRDRPVALGDPTYKTAVENPEIHDLRGFVQHYNTLITPVEYGLEDPDDWTRLEVPRVSGVPDAINLAQALGSPGDNNFEVIYMDTQGRPVAIQRHHARAIETMPIWFDQERKSVAAYRAVLLFSNEDLFHRAGEAAIEYELAGRKAGINDLLLVDPDETPALRSTYVIDVEDFPAAADKRRKELRLSRGRRRSVTEEVPEYGREEEPETLPDLSEDKPAEAKVRNALRKLRPRRIRPDDYLTPSKFALDVEGQDAVRDEMARIAEEYGLEKIVVPWDVTRAVAEELGQNGAELEARLRATDEGRLNAPEMLAIRSIVSGNLDAMLEIQSLVQRGETPDGKPLSREEADRMSRTLDALYQQNEILLSRFTQDWSQTGRDLNALKIIAEKTHDPVFWISQAQRFHGAPISDQQQAEITRLAKAKETDALIQKVYEFKKATLGEMIGNLIKVGYLSAPPTHMVNIISTAVHQTMEMTKDVPASMYDRVLAVLAQQLGGRERAVRSKSLGLDQWAAALAGAKRGFEQIVGLKGLAAGSAAGAAAGMAVGAPWAGATVGGIVGFTQETIAEQKRRARIGRGEEEIEPRPEAPAGRRTLEEGVYRKWEARRIDYGNDLLNTWLEMPYRALGAADRLFKQSMAEYSLRQQARVIAKAEGLHGDALDARVEELYETPTDEMAVTAIEAAEQAVFQNQTLIGRAGGQLRHLMGQAGTAGQISREWVIPFTRTPGAVATQVWNYSPLGLFSGDWHEFVRLASQGEDVTEVQRRLAERLGRVTVGAAPIVLGFILRSVGKMTLGLPATGGDDDERESAEDIRLARKLGRTKTQGRWMITGAQENAVLIDDVWYSLERVSPWGNLVVFGGYLYDTVREQEKGFGTYLMPFASIFRTVGEQSFMEGTRTFLELVMNMEREAGRFGTNIVRSLIPNIIQRTARTLDPIVRESDTPLEEFQRRTPFLSKNLPPMRDPLGAPLRYRQGALHNLLDPWYSREAKTDDPVRAEIDRVGAGISPRRRGKDETKEEFDQRIDFEGRVIYQTLRSLIGSETYQNLPRAVHTAYDPEMFDVDALGLAYQRSAIEEAVSDARRRVTRVWKLRQQGRR